MSFTSFQFILFLPIVFILYWIVVPKYQWFVILISSYYFYMCWNVKYALLILFVTVVSYISALLIKKYSNHKKLFLLISIIVCFLCLFFFKYFNFLSETVYSLSQFLGLHTNKVVLEVILPVGISFYTFQSMSYVIDVYRGGTKEEHHFGKYAAFVSFFPQLVAGPIERTDNLLPQISGPRKFDCDKAIYGFKLMAIGFFKKLVLADTTAKLVDNIYNSLYLYKGFALVGATFLFGIQIYCDFSGYSDIARGVAKLFGIDLIKNFESPYFSKSIKEFWGRWHISLSTWFRDYVYIPLGGNRVSKTRHYCNLVITFLVSGLWHGANWTFVLWGGCHGMLQVLENAFSKKKNTKSRNRVIDILRMVSVYIVVSSVWLFFRAQNFEEVSYILSNSFCGISNLKNYLIDGYNNLDLNKKIVAEMGVALTILLAYDYYSLKFDVFEKIGKLSPILRYAIYFIFVWLIIILAPIKSSSEFVYFQF